MHPRYLYGIFCLQLGIFNISGLYIKCIAFELRLLSAQRQE